MAPNRRFAAGLICIALVAAIAATDRAQSSDDLPRFEAVSVKPNNRGDGLITIRGRGSHYVATGVSLRALIQNAYNVQEFQIVGGPDWIDTAKFDISAAEPDTSPTAAPSGGPSRRSLMIQAMLQDRFALVTHTETREMPVYAIVPAKNDRTLGPKMRKSSVDCAALTDAARGGGPPRGIPSPVPRCGSNVGPGFVLAGDRTMAQFAEALSRLTMTGSSLNRLIIDRTGLEGSYDIELHFTPERIPNFGPDGPPRGIPPIDPNGPSLFTAVQEQLGLKLDAQRGPVTVVVIDKVERPSED